MPVVSQRGLLNDYPPSNGTKYRLESLEHRARRVEEKLDNLILVLGKQEVLAQRIQNMEDRHNFLVKLLGGVFGMLVIICITIILVTGGIQTG